MAFQTAPDTCEVVIDYLMSGAPTANVLHYTRTGGGTQAQLDTLAAGQDSTVGAELGSLFTPTQQYVQVRVRRLVDALDLASSNGDSAFTGSRVAEAQANNVSLCVTFRTGLTGRSARGRFYMQPPADEDSVGPNQVSTTYANAVLHYVNALHANAVSNGWTPVVLSRRHLGVLRPAALPIPITSVILRNHRTDSQRGRMPTPD